MATFSHGSGLLNEYARTLIRIKARQLIRRPEFSRSDQPDIEQELFAHLLQRAQKFDPARGSRNTFVARVVDTGVAMLLRQRRRRKRTPAGNAVVHSLEAMADQSDDRAAPLWAMITRCDQGRLTGADATPWVALHDLADSIEFAIRELPPELRDICRRLMRRGRCDLARELGLSRRKFAAAMLAIRRRFERCGFGEI